MTSMIYPTTNPAMSETMVVARAEGPTFTTSRASATSRDGRAVVHGAGLRQRGGH